MNLLWGDDLKGTCFVKIGYTLFSSEIKASRQSNYQIKSSLHSLFGSFQLESWQNLAITWRFDDLDSFYVDIYCLYVLIFHCGCVLFVHE